MNQIAQSSKGVLYKSISVLLERSVFPESVSASLWLPTLIPVLFSGFSPNVSSLCPRTALQRSEALPCELRASFVQGPKSPAPQLILTGLGS